VDALLECGAIETMKPLLLEDDPAVLEGATSVIALLCVPFEGKEEAVRVTELLSPGSASRCLAFQMFMSWCVAFHICVIGMCCVVVLWSNLVLRGAS
jgi:hypothetical protein